ncbi:polymorphic toxin-type HINT domain-containing protein [Acinetobacter dispersus]|uniref:polymorphic toxin-type HINT domain-containing protein n=1 Tax=Acinetobacter dispersus TaxID=70348 RepID=UPI00132F3799|nr:polymorphic toxin-type HINT domain-containing protein [Acinetobacter dispersus]QHH96412.1 hypothetical protein FPL17_02225 [Acinetobacter dispersus]
MKFKLLFVSILLALHQVHAAELELVGSLEGGTNVDSLGVLSHSIPIAIPPSINGFIPQLALSYSGESPDGILGVGWNVTGLSSIVRCNELNGNIIHTPMGSAANEIVADYQASGSSTSSLFKNSCFALDGKKLIRISADNIPVSSTEFRLENDDFTKITIQMQPSNSGYSNVLGKFIVKQKDGVVREYAATLNSNFKSGFGESGYSNGQEIIEWNLTSVKDVNGNYWTVEYQDLNKGILYPKTIKYTGNSGNSSVAPINSIDFEYTDRIAAEIRQGFIESGSTRILDKKLSKLSIKSNNVVKGEYRFQYEDINDQVANKTRLKDIKYCTVNGSDQSCLTPTKLEWSSYGKDLMTMPLRDSINQIPDVKVSDTLNTIRMSTTKGIKTKELIFLAKIDNNLKLYSNPVDPMSAALAVTLTHPSLSSFQQWSPTMMDVNGDGIDDLVIYGRNSSNQVSLLLFTTSYSSPNGLFSFYKEHKNIFTTPSPLLNISTLDGDRDGKLDLVMLFGDQNDIRFNGIKLDGVGNIASVNTTVIGSNIRNTLNASSGKRVTTTERILNGNFRRDKKQDIIFYYTSSSGLSLCSISVYRDVIQSSKTINDCENSTPVLISGTAGDAYKDYDFSVVDFNGDGLDDIVMSKVIRLDAANGPATRFHERLIPILSTGGGFEIQSTHDLPVFEVNTTDWISDWERHWYYKPNFVDFNHDGLIDFYRYANSWLQNSPDKQLRYSSVLTSYLQRPNKKFDIFKYDFVDWWKGYTIFEEHMFALIGMPGDIKNSDYNVERIPFFSDINNNGFQEINFQFIVRPRTGTGAYIYSFISQAAKQEIDRLAQEDTGFRWMVLRYPGIDFQDMLKSIDTGDGRKQKFIYSNFSQAPESMEARPFPIRGSGSVSLVTYAVENYLNNALGSQSTYLFASPRVDAKENRFLGFETMTETSETYNKTASGTDVTNKLVKETVFNQNYPFVGMAKSVTTKANDALVSKVTVADADFVSDSAYPTTKVKFPRVKKSTVQNYDLGKLISTTVTSDNYENVFGNLIDSSVTTTSADGASVFSTSVKPVYSAADRTNWIPGLVKERTVTSSRTGQPTLTKKSTFDYDAKQQLKQKVDEPNNAALKLQSDYEYDNYGNLSKVTVSGAGNGTDTNIGSRVVNSFYEAGAGHPAGVFKTRETNALSQQASSSYDAVTGQMLTSTDLNGVVSKQTVDSLGRVKVSTPAGAAQTTNDYQLCKTFVGVGTNSRECETGENYKTTSTTALNAPVLVFKDAVGNVKRTVTKAYDNVNDVVVRSEYDASGRLYRSSVPSLSNVAYGSLQWTSYEYDVLGRVTKLVEPGNRVTTYTYDGLQSSIINAKGLKRTEKSNIANEVVEILDHDNNALKYTRDALGRLIQTTDALGNSIVLTLDNNGNKLQQVDPVLGTWKYRYNPLGQVVWQQDAKGQQTTFQYDALGRLKQRVEPDLSSTWTWDTAANGKGKLAQVSSANGYSESYAYDAFGRLFQTTTSKKIDPKAQGATDPDFISKWNYDAAGRTLAFAYPTGFGYRNIYDTNGYLKEVRNLAGNQLYWAANARDARGNITQETLGNGLVTKKGYKADTGFIESINTGNAAIQQNSYAFDAIGNLENRNQNLAGISINESFVYDNINRLKSVVNQKGVTTSVTYNAIGNILSKSDTGTYNYATGGTNCGIQKVCAISSTTGGLNTAFSYDVNGNLLTGNNRTSSWSSFNMPLQIKQGTTTEDFMYDANHERVRRTSVEGGKTTTTVYLNPRIDTGGTFEKSYLPDGTTEYAHYIYAGGGVVGSYVSNDKGTPPTGDLGTAYQSGVAPNSAVAAINKTGPYRYFHTDHLDSIEVITDAAGNPLERLSYDPWGKRRNVDGTVSTDTLKGKSSRHGFTSHEMLDSIGLIHMNGRVYDPSIGRFISADPTIDGADNLQGYNRYAYVHNNPGTLLDPDGYGWTKFWKRVGKDIKNGLNKVLDDWLGTCSKAKGDCGVSVGVTYGPNNPNGENDGRPTLRPKIGIGGGLNHDDYSFEFKYDSNGLTFDKFYFPQQYALPGFNYFDIGTLRAAFDFSYSANDYITYFDTPQDIAAKLSSSAYGTNEDKAARRAWLSYQIGDNLYALGEAWDMSPVGMRADFFPIAKAPGMGLKAVGRLLIGDCGCFDDDTPVLTKDGYKRIVEINEGDLVLARHEETGEIAYKPVKRVFVVPNRRIYLLKTLDQEGKENTIEVSDDHPFWVVDKKWVESINLKEGDQLLDANNQVHKVVSFTETDRVETTYNLEVEGYHTYFAGDANIWVHNAGPCKMWNAGSFESATASLEAHFKKHGKEVGASDVDSYMRKAQGFSNNLKGADVRNVEGRVEGVKRYIKNGKYIDIAPDNTIISFGSRNR